MTDWSKSVSDFLNAKIWLKEKKNRSPDKLILGHVSINSIKNKCYSLVYMLDKKVNIFLISETKLDESSLGPTLKWKISQPRIGMTERIKEVVFYCISGRAFHHVYCNVNRSAIYKIFSLRSI